MSGISYSRKGINKKGIQVYVFSERVVGRLQSVDISLPHKLRRFAS